MDELKIFNSSEFGEIRTVMKDGEPMFCLADVCKALGLEQVSRVKTRLKDDGVTTSKVIDRIGREQEATFINESNLYKTIFQSRKESAERFTDWVTTEVLPSIRKTGAYGKPLSTSEQIRLLAQGNTELTERVDKVETKITSLENDMPLYGCEIDEVSKHVKRKAVDVLGGKDSEAYRDGSIRSQIFSNIYTRIKMEYGVVSSYKSIKRKYIADVHDFIDSYEPPRFLEEQILDANAQMRFGT
jgi:prophage antirepressor-like protein